MEALAFLLAAAALGVLAVGAILQISHVAMSSSKSIARDGLPRGAFAPSWTLPDSAGATRASPPATGMQLIVFTDHSLNSFPGVVEGLQWLRSAAPQVEPLILLRARNDLAETVLGLLGLGGLPLVTGSPDIYAKYNVRALPWLMFVDEVGRVRASSLVNHVWQIERLFRLANVSLLENEQDHLMSRSARQVAV